MRLLICCLFMLCTTSFAQTIEQPLDSLRAPFSTKATYSAEFRLETLSPTTGKPTLTGSAYKLGGFSLLTEDHFAINLVGNKTTAVVISGVRATFTAIPGPDSGWEPTGPYGVRIKFATPFALPAGSFVGCRYDMPRQKFYLSTMSFAPAGNGRLKCVVGAKADTIGPPPVPVPPVTQPPIPISPDGTWFTTESLSGVILSVQGPWTFGVAKADGNRAILLNGIVSGIDGVRLEMIAGKVHTTNKAGVLSQWSGTAWVQISAPPVAVVKSLPGDCISAVAAGIYPCKRLVTKIITADLAEWTFTWLPPAKAFRNGVNMKLPYLDATMIYMSNSTYIKGFSPSRTSNNQGYICWNGVVWGTGC